MRLSSTEYDQYHRVLAEVFDSQGRNINLIMVQQGLAWAYRQYMHDKQYLAAEAQARQQRRGLWQDDNPIYPSNWRKHSKNPSLKLDNPPAPTLDSIAMPKHQAKTVAATSNCQQRRSCKSFSSCAEATAFFKQCNAEYLDGNHDGIPCNSLCR